MTLAIGTDIVEIQRIKDVFERQGDRIVKRILTAKETEQFLSLPNDDIKIAFLAKRWCGKEAVAKALGTGIAKGIGFQQIEISNDALGAPEVALFDGALKRLQEMAGKGVLISLSDERQYALAYCNII